MAKIPSNDLIVLLNFLKSSLTTNELDRLLGHDSKQTKGWRSFKILKKYRLFDSDKGRLFLFTEEQSKKIIKEIMLSTSRKSVESIIKSAKPSNLDKYHNTYIIAPTENSFYDIFKGETRNIINYFFSPRRKLIEHCQYKGCKKRQLETAHFLQERPELFLKAAKHSIESKAPNKLIKYSVFKTMQNFLLLHKPRKSVCFLCKTHHLELHKQNKISKQALKKFKKNILWK